MFKFPSDELIQLNNLGQQRPKTTLFIVAGIEGNCNVFEPLAEILTQHDTLVFGLQYTLNVPYTSIQDTACFYIEKIRLKLNELNIKTFQIAGYSYGKLNFDNL